MSKKSKAVALKYNVEEDLAPIVIESNQDEGVAHAIRRYILGNIVPPPKNRQKGERP